MFDRAIQTAGDPAFGHRAHFDRAIQTAGDPAFGHRAHEAPDGYQHPKRGR
jgi:hypothetical protein